jgi:hypothetical protein
MPNAPRKRSLKLQAAGTVTERKRSIGIVPCTAAFGQDYCKSAVNVAFPSQTLSASIAHLKLTNPQ